MVTIICATDARQSWLCLDCERESKRRTERERERERGETTVVEKGRGDSTPPPVERGCIHRPPCRRGSQSWVSISRGTWWERRNIPGWPIPASPRLPRDSIPPCLVPDSTSERVLTDPCQSSPRYQSHSFSCAPCAAPFRHPSSVSHRD